MKKENCTYYDNGYCKKGLPGTTCIDATSNKGGRCVAYYEGELPHVMPIADEHLKVMHKHYNEHRGQLLDLSLTWKDCKRIVEIADALTEYAEVGIIEPFLSSEEAFYKEVLKRFKEEKQ